MKKRVVSFFIKGKRFQREFKRQLRMLITVTLGFTIAFTWRQTIFDLSLNFLKLVTAVKDSSFLSFLTSTFITLISLILIYLTSVLLRDSPEDY